MKRKKHCTNRSTIVCSEDFALSFASLEHSTDIEVLKQELKQKEQQVKQEQYEEKLEQERIQK